VRDLPGCPRPEAQSFDMREFGRPRDFLHWSLHDHAPTEFRGRVGAVDLERYVPGQEKSSQLRPLGRAKDNRLRSRVEDIVDRPDDRRRWPSGRADGQTAKRRLGQEPKTIVTVQYNELVRASRRPSHARSIADRQLVTRRKERRAAEPVRQRPGLHSIRLPPPAEDVPENAQDARLVGRCRCWYRATDLRSTERRKPLARHE
jgi:hypothetical protein